ncbi:MAG: hypothetical protein HYS12_13015 [Planctomycetes bacterium]|nr:hypothetical protein [Planctomycetota bacterium]
MGELRRTRASTLILRSRLATVKNFTKFLIGRNGEIIQRFEPRVKPEQMTEAIEAELKK